MGLRRVTPPKQEPLTLAEAKEHLRILHTAEDAILEEYIADARSMCEEWERRSYVTQTWELTLDRFPRATEQNPYATIPLPRPPVQSVESVTYIDTSGEERTLDSSLYALKNPSGPALLAPAHGTTWPATRRELDAVRVRYVAGYGDTGFDVPERVRQAMRLHLGTSVAFREGVVAGVSVTDLPGGAKARLTDRMQPVET